MSIEDCRGQDYDNEANMAGKYKGVQAQISSINGLGSFVPCAAHTLNLVGVHAAEVSPLKVLFFGCVQKIFTFFSNSISRWENLMKELSISLKGVTTTVKPDGHQKKEAVA